MSTGVRKNFKEHDVTGVRPLYAKRRKEMTSDADKMLRASMKKAVEVGLLSRQVDTGTYLMNWEGMKAVLQASLDAERITQDPV